MIQISLVALVLVMMSNAPAAFGTSLADFLYGSLSLEFHHVLDRSNCERRLSLYPNAGEYEQALEAEAGAAELIDAWAESVESREFFAAHREDFNKDAAIMFRLSHHFTLPPKFSERFELSRVLLELIERYRGFVATREALTALKFNLWHELTNYPPDDEPTPADKRRWTHDIYVLAEQIVLHNLRSTTQLAHPEKLIEFVHAVND